MYAPVVLRFNTYRAQVSDTARWYMATALEDPPLQEWVQAAQKEPWTSPVVGSGLRRTSRTSHSGDRPNARRDRRADAPLRGSRRGG